MKIIRFFIITLCFLVPTTAFAGNTDINSTIKNFTTDNVDRIYANNNGTEFSGNRIENTVQDTRTEEQKREDELKAKANEINKKLQDIKNQLNQGGTFDSDDLPDLGDFIENNKEHIGEVNTPQWTIKDNEPLKDEFDENAVLDAFKKWLKDVLKLSDEEIEKIIDRILNPQDPDKPVQEAQDNPSPNDTEKTTPQSGMAVKETDTVFIKVSQTNYPIEAIATYAKIQSELKKENQEPLEKETDKNPPEVQVTNKDEIVHTATTTPSTVDQERIDWVSFYEDFRKKMYDQLNTKPGQTNKELEDEFVNNPDISNKNDFLGDGIHEGTLPGTDITIKVPDNYDELYKQLMDYLNQLKELNRIGAVINQYEIYQIENIDIQTIHKSIPTNEYRWVVSGPNGTIERTTDISNIKILFQSEGTYNVKVYNTRNVYRNNRVSGTKSEVWVIANGGYFDGLVIYRNDTKFEGFISEDIGPTIEEIELKKNGFTAIVTPSMLNKVQIIDENGNIRTSADGFTTERN